MNPTKHTIKIDTAKAIVIQPAKAGRGVSFGLELFGATMASAILSADHCAALILAVQVAQEQSNQRHEKS